MISIQLTPLNTQINRLSNYSFKSVFKIQIYNQTIRQYHDQTNHYFDHNLHQTQGPK